MGLEHILLVCITGVTVIGMSKRQPFPEVSKRFGAMLLLIGAIGIVAQNAPTPPSDRSWQYGLTFVGGIGVVVGMRHLTYTRMDVLIAPFSGILLCAGSIGLLWDEWSVLSEFEQIASFILSSFLCIGEVYLVFRGLLIGRLPQAWSQAGLRNLQRGLIDGPNGALACFEKAWDVEKEHLNPMAYLALQRIYAAKGDIHQSNKWAERLIEQGGEKAVDEAWIKAIERALSSSGIKVHEGE
ncbi:MAG: hypothetical protein QF707_00695 [Candidatus Poseidoniaceae archaeon]|jgi:hypothetical protein|nr:hypothetical protein [Candidatus Poseidoniaceae archaeon]MDP7202665.1 hypothetical protein [Candidatus Poseidoniaceae archaeon]